MSVKLDGVALITGAASGIGLAVAKLFAAAGCEHLVLVDRDESGLKEAIRDGGFEESRVTAKSLDILDDKAVEALVGSIHEAHGSLDYAINSAGIAGVQGIISQVAMADIDKTISINLRAQILLNKVEAAAMLKNPDPNDSFHARGVIVNLSSVLGMKAIAVNPGYVIAKHGVIGLTKTMATTFAANGIRTNAIAPGFIDSAMTRETITEPARQFLLATTPQKRMGLPEEIARVALFLCSDGASFMNGTVVTADGGWLA